MTLSFCCSSLLSLKHTDRQLISVVKSIYFISISGIFSKHLVRGSENPLLQLVRESLLRPGFMNTTFSSFALHHRLFVKSSAQKP